MQSSEEDFLETRKAKIGSAVVIRMEKGEEVCSSILKACEQHGVKTGFVMGIGALRRAVVASGLSVDKKVPKPVEFTGPMEIASAVGNIVTKDGKPSLHLHMALGLDDHTSVAGHLVEGEISLTGEFVILESDAKIKRKWTEKLGMNLWNLD